MKRTGHAVTLRKNGVDYAVETGDEFPKGLAQFASDIYKDDPEGWTAPKKAATKSRFEKPLTTEAPKE